MKTPRKEAGFTLVELLIAIVCNAILILTVAIILFITWREWRVNTRVVQMRRDAAFVTQLISRDIRESRLTDDHGNEGITFETERIVFAANPPVRKSVHVYDKDGATLRRRVGGGTWQTLIGSGVADFESALDGSQVGVVLELEDSALDLSITNLIVVTVRN